MRVTRYPVRQQPPRWCPLPLENDIRDRSAINRKRNRLPEPVILNFKLPGIKLQDKQL